ncbi:uncharacterized protein EDB91DRAFT_1079356 [Suillus paluster]|uniref:uncharacterized protein n=1 Tax=Suillus paluster TaxID=48578 RepID=UPI001B86EFDC|nr:uncharacterized protein EDB91DRAFT_1079356 [Suillus paluster]KAG1748382.1 hypothetical protein EDB91DRAFT_1079356 [Suillus paluster]
MERETSGLRGRVEDKPICHLNILRDNRLVYTLPGRVIAPSRTSTQSKNLTDTMKIQFTYLAVLAAAAGVKAAPSNTEAGVLKIRDVWNPDAKRVSVSVKTNVTGQPPATSGTRNGNRCIMSEISYSGFMALQHVAMIQ